MRQRVTDSHRAEIRQMHDSGYSTAAISAKTGVNRKSVLRVLVSMGLDVSANRWKRADAPQVKPKMTQEQKAEAHRKYSQEQIDKALSLRMQGMSVADISVETKMSIGACCFYFRRHGVHLTREQAVKNQKRFSPEMSAAIVELRLQGLDREKIAEKLGVSLSGVKDVLKRAGVVISDEQKKANCQEGKAKFYERYVLDILPNIAAQSGGKFLGPYLGSQVKALWECQEGHTFWRRPNDVVCQGLNCPECAPKSRPQTEIFDFVKSLCPDAIMNDRTVIAPKEIDILVPSKRVAIEFNGLYWHSEACPNFVSGAEADKAAKCKAAGLKFFMIFQDEWASKRDLIKAMIQSRLGLSAGKRLNARDLQVREIDNSESRTFLERNHIDGYTLSSWGVALFYEGKPVAVATVRRGLAQEWELARFACDYDFVVRGAAGKLIAAVKKKLNGSLVTYSNNRIGSGDVYRGLGFREITESTSPGYWYTDCKGHRISRYKCQRVNAPEILNEFPTEKEQAAAGVFSEKEFGDKRPLFRIEDCGHRKWILE